MSVGVKSPLLVSGKGGVHNVTASNHLENNHSLPHLPSNAPTAFLLRSTSKYGKLKRQASVNFPLLRRQWTAIKPDWNVIHSIRKSSDITESGRKNSKITNFTTAYLVWDTIKYGWCKAPKHNYNPFVRTSLIRATVSDDTDDNHINDNSQRTKCCASTEKETEDEAPMLQSIDLRSTLPIYNGGNDVRFKKCDRNTHIFSLKQKEWLTSWLSFEVVDDRILTGHDTFIGAVTMNLSGIKDEGQVYYTQLPLINKENISPQEYNTKFSISKKSDAKKEDELELESGYERVVTDDLDLDSTPQVTDMLAQDEHVNMMGVLHVTAVKKIKKVSDGEFDNMQDIFNENKNECFDLEIEILAITTMKQLHKSGMDDRKFKFGIIGFILYLLFYAMIMFVAELHTSTGMNEYKESIWFALITVSTLGYGDITAQTIYSKILNSFFIAINVIVIAGFVSDLLGYAVTAGEDALDARMNHVMTGAQDVFEHNRKSLQPKLEEMRARKQITAQQSAKHASSYSAHEIQMQKVTQELEKKLTIRDRTSSMPALRDLNDHEEKETKLSKTQRKKAILAVEEATTKATKLKLDQLTELNAAEERKFQVQLYVNISIFILTLLFGFFALGVAQLLTGPNFLTNLPYFGYECRDDNDPHCELHDDARSVFSDSLYYSVVSITTVGYGDIYPQTNALSRILGALFILFGTMILVRLVDLWLSRMLWKNTSGQKKRTLGQLLTSSKDFFEFDLDQNGVVDKYEFLVGMLLKLDLVDMERIDEIMTPFHEIDADKNGFVEMNELKAKVYEDRMKLRWGENAWTEIKQSWDTIKYQHKHITAVQKKLKEKEESLKRKTGAFEQEKVKWEKQKKAEIKQLRKEYEKLRKTQMNEKEEDNAGRIHTETVSVKIDK